MMKELKPLAQHEAERMAVFTASLQADAPRPNGLACDFCGGELWDSAPMRLLTSYPPRLEVHCPGCGWKGTRLR